jgi:hypothetical protein
MEATVFVSLGHGLDGGLEGVSLGRRSLDAESGRVNRSHSFGKSRPELRERESSYLNARSISDRSLSQFGVSWRALIRKSSHTGSLSRDNV